MSASLVGSEMCIRDRAWRRRSFHTLPRRWPRLRGRELSMPRGARTSRRPCLLYTSDAADDM
eukprot:9024962-Alexandrium_andersonii.AAC.1